MSVQLSPSDPVVSFDPQEWERQVALFCQSHGIANNAAYVAGVNGMTAGSALELAAIQALCKATKLSP